MPSGAVVRSASHTSLPGRSTSPSPGAETFVPFPQKVWSAMFASTYLRGLSTDLQSPLLTALRETFTVLPGAFGATPGGLRLLERLKECSTSWPTDLAAGHAQATLVTDTYLATLCHYLDRFAALPLLFEVAEENSLIARVGRIHSSYSDFIAPRRERVAKAKAPTRPRSRKK